MELSKTTLLLTLSIIIMFMKFNRANIVNRSEVCLFARNSLNTLSSFTKKDDDQTKNRLWKYSFRLLANNILDKMEVPTQLRNEVDDLISQINQHRISYNNIKNISRDIFVQQLTFLETRKVL